MVYKRRKIVTSIFVAFIALGLGMLSEYKEEAEIRGTELSPAVQAVNTQAGAGVATEALSGLIIKGRAPKTGYAREQFGNGWADVEQCDMRNYILQRDLTEVAFDSSDGCTVLSGVLQDKYTGKTIHFKRGERSSSDVQIDHVVALSDGWQKGAQNIDVALRAEFANDPLNLLAVDGPANNKKRDSDAASWLPPSKSYHCQYVARQIAVKKKYSLWVTQAEHDSMKKVLQSCPAQQLPIVD